MICIKLYEGHNIKKLHLLGKGHKGKVYKINEEKCIKIFKKHSYCFAEVETLVMSQIDSHFPILYSFGDNYLIREYVQGVNLQDYLKCNEITKDITLNILDIYESIVWIGFKSKDISLLDLFITPRKEIKMISTSKLMKQECQYPITLLYELRKMKKLDTFLEIVKLQKTALYKKWVNYLHL